MIKRIFSVVFTGMLALSCACTTADSKTGPDPVKKDVEYCSLAQTHLQQMCSADPIKNKLCCDMVRPTPKQRSFEQVCRTVQEGGIYVNPQCISTVQTCEQVDTICMQNNATDDGGSR